jgi:hypothetical protein
MDYKITYHSGLWNIAYHQPEPNLDAAPTNHKNWDSALKKLFDTYGACSTITTELPDFNYIDEALFKQAIAVSYHQNSGGSQDA